MVKVLVVDDSPVDRRLAGSLLEKRSGPGGQKTPTGITVIYAANGKEGLAALASEMPDLVLSDMQMPEMNGLELVETVKNQFPKVPVIIMTAHGSEEIARQALQGGAASYVPKRDLAGDLFATVEEILNLAAANEQKQRLLGECLRRSEAQFLLPNNMGYIAPLIGHLQESLIHMKICDDNGLIRVAVCLREALTNAIIHGNLQIDSALRDPDEKDYYSQIESRSQEEPYADRFVHVTARETPEEAHYTIRDEGEGFDFRSLPDPTDPANLERVHGRGMLLIQTFMDEVRHNSTGNEITMIKRRDRD